MTSEKQREINRKASRKYAAVHPKEIQASRRRWSTANPEKRRETARKWAAANPEKTRAADRKWQQTPRGRESHREASRKYAAANPEKMFARKLKRLYGLSIADYRRMLEEQDGVCALCYKDFNGTITVDHDHETDVVRGLLHQKCNAMLGYANDDRMLLGLGMTYLDRCGVQL